MSTTVFAPRVATEARLLRDAVRAGRAHTTVPQATNPRAGTLAKELLSREGDQRRRAFEHVCELVGDMAERGAIEHAEAVCSLMLAMVHQRYRDRFGAGQVLPIPEAHATEQALEGAVNRRETMMSHFPTVSNWLAYLADRGRYARAVLQLDRSVRAAVVRELVANNEER